MGNKYLLVIGLITFSMLGCGKKREHGTDYLAMLQDGAWRTNCGPGDRPNTSQRQEVQFNPDLTMVIRQNIYNGNDCQMLSASPSTSGMYQLLDVGGEHPILKITRQDDAQQGGQSTTHFNQLAFDELGMSLYPMNQSSEGQQQLNLETQASVWYQRVERL
jgi:hypothetical protein